MAPARTNLGTLVGDPLRFPRGMKAVGDELHALGLRFGLYTDVGKTTCEGLPASYSHEAVDALTFAAWGVDYVKADFCNTPPGATPQSLYSLISSALNATGRPMVLSLCSWGNGAPFGWARNLAHSWRTGRDLFAVWDAKERRALGLPSFLQSVMEAVEGEANSDRFAGPFAFNDADMLVVGLDGMTPYGIVESCPPAVPDCTKGEYISRERWGKVGGLTLAEQKTHFFFWVMLASPLMLGNDPRTMSKQTLALLKAPEVLSIQRDAMAAQGFKVPGSNGVHEVFCRPLEGDGERLQFALLVFNPTSIALGRGEVRVDLRLSLVPFEERHGKPPEDVLADVARAAMESAAASHPACASPDTSKHCEGWARAGECANNPGFMRVQCACSCATSASKPEPRAFTEQPAAPGVVTRLGRRFIKERAEGGTVKVHVRDAFARKDHGVFEDSLVWPGEIEPHGAELLLVTVMLDGDTTAPSLPSTTYVDREVEEMIDEASLMGGSIPEHSSPVSRREFLALGVAAIEACAIAVLLCVVKTQARRPAPPVLRGKYV